MILGVSSIKLYKSIIKDRRKENIKEFIDDGVVRVYGDNNDGSFIVDVDDYYFIKNWFWRKDPKGYWTTNAKKEDEETYGKKSLRLHQLIAERKYDKYDTVDEDEWDFEEFKNNCGINFDELFNLDEKLKTELLSLIKTKSK